MLLDATVLQLHPVFGTSKGATTLFHKAELLAAATQLAGTGRGGIFKRGDEKMKNHQGE